MSRFKPVELPSSLPSKFGLFFVYFNFFVDKIIWAVSRIWTLIVGVESENTTLPPPRPSNQYNLPWPLTWLSHSRTIEYMSPEVMNCSEASPASDVWGIGVITYQLLSGGISPFFAVNRFRTMSKVLECDFSLDQVRLGGFIRNKQC